MRGRGHRVARPRPGLLAARRSRHGRSRPTASASATPDAWCSSCSGSSVDLSLAGPAEPDGDLARYATQYAADAARFGPPTAPAAAGERDAREPGHHHEPSVNATHPETAETVAQPVKVDNDLYVRDYSRCILCYKCVEACGEDAQNTFAIAVAGRGFDARISTEFDVPLPESACVYCGNCIGVCPTGALMFKSEFDMREAGTWAPKSRPSPTRSAPTAASAARCRCTSRTTGS